VHEQPPPPNAGYTASAGIAANKLLAKIGSAMHKPAQQTLIPPRAVQHVMQVGCRVAAAPHLAFHFEG
jgi:nucleotidyltransferase/DNA polymerase involved in DNA repair